ncbi:MFS transporter [Derxia gummosa]|uniref:MFS transporter n=1 Tax=Derxia gummosa DSM 723 TaxID=1121388 RepID=A0A8B6X7G5_9BURK|nr:MFS transporter [Derxia gummosa]
MLPPLRHRLSLTTVLVCGGLVVTLAMGIRHGFGFWQLPITQERGWSRETFAFALAVQNLLWGASQPFAGMLADRYGAFRVLALAVLCYAGGLVLMALAPNVPLFDLGAGVLIGVACSGTTYSLVYGVIGRTAAPAKRSQALGICAAAGSFGQFAMVPLSQWLIHHLGWQEALFGLAACALLMLPLGLGLREPKAEAPAGGAAVQSPLAAAREAFATPAFRWLMAGYFVCGFQVVFIGVHLPAYLRDKAMDPQVAVWALALIGLFNIFGTWTAGQLGARLPNKFLLSGIYVLRALIIAGWLALPLTAASTYVFAAAMGFLWLATVPLTSGVIATVFGVRYLGMLSGFVFFSHQVGSFLGVWLGGWLYDRRGNYDVVWAITIALGVFAGLVNLPIRERPMARLAAGAA